MNDPVKRAAEAIDEALRRTSVATPELTDADTKDMEAAMARYVGIRAERDQLRAGLSRANEEIKKLQLALDHSQMEKSDHRTTYERQIAALELDAERNRASDRAEVERANDMARIAQDALSRREQLLSSVTAMLKDAKLVEDMPRDYGPRVLAGIEKDLALLSDQSKRN